MRRFYERKEMGRDMTMRLRILWAAIVNLFTGRGVFISENAHVEIGTASMAAGVWIKQDAESEWEHWWVVFDGKKARGYVDGSET